jgi:citrate lyase subunit beta/citryl-CoA lyase
MLYVSGASTQHLQKSRGLESDSLIFDLDETVHASKKALAREQIGAVLKAGGFRGQEIVIRVNRTDSEWFADDLEWVAKQPGVDAILFPQAESAATMRHAQDQLDMAGGGKLRIMVMIETPLGVLHAEEIAAASDRLTALILNTNSLEAKIGAFSSPDRIGLLGTFARVILAARAYGRAVIDGAHINLGEAHSCEFSCRQGRELGFDGKTVVHPIQLPYTNEAYTPKPKDVERARAVIDCMREADERQEAVAQLNGRVLSPEQVEFSQRIIAMAEGIEERKLAFAA